MKNFVYLVDDELLALEELKVLLQPFEDLEIVGFSDRVEEAIEECNRLKPDLIFLDINMSGKDGFEFLESHKGFAKVAVVLFLQKLDLGYSFISVCEVLLHECFCKDVRN